MSADITDEAKSSRADQEIQEEAEIGMEQLMLKSGRKIGSRSEINDVAQEDSEKGFTEPGEN